MKSEKQYEREAQIGREFLRQVKQYLLSKPEIDEISSGWIVEYCKRKRELDKPFEHDIVYLTPLFPNIENGTIMLKSGWGKNVHISLKPVKNDSNSHFYTHLYKAISRKYNNVKYREDCNAVIQKIINKVEDSEQFYNAILDYTKLLNTERRKPLFLEYEQREAKLEKLFDQKLEEILK